MPTPETCKIYMGSSQLSKLCLGSYEVARIYLGNNLIYDAQPDEEESNFLLKGGDYLYCANGAIFDTRMVSVETASGDTITTSSGENIQVYDE